MIIFFSRITRDHWFAKNKLEAAAKEMARTMDRQIIPERLVPLFESDVQRKISELNERFSRCKPLVLNSSSAFPNPNEYASDREIGVPGVFQITLFQMSEEPLFDVGVFEIK